MLLPYPRPIPGVPVAHNLRGVSFAVANMTGLVARSFGTVPRTVLREALIAQGSAVILESEND